LVKSRKLSQAKPSMRVGFSKAWHTFSSAQDCFCNASPIRFASRHYEFKGKLKDTHFVRTHRNRRFKGLTYTARNPLLAGKQVIRNVEYSL